MPSNTASAPHGLPLRRVLIAEGDPDTRGLYREVFVECGWNVTEADDGREALVRALSERASVVITELWLPYIDGIALCRLLRRDLATSNVPILVVTSEIRPVYLKQAERAGANAILMKPSTPNVILAEMDRLTQDTTLAPPFVRPEAARKSLVKAHLRFETRSPNEPVPDIFCPRCMRPLAYQKTFFGGVSR